MVFAKPAWLNRNIDNVTQPVLGADAVARPVFVVVVLVVVIVCSSLAVTYSAFQYRLLFNQQQILISQWDDFQVEWGQLLLEQSALGTNNRVEQIARKQLDMMIPQPAMIEMVQYER